jgi:hypothetical protein
MPDQQSLYELKHTRTPFSAWLGIVLLFVVFAVIVLAIVGPSPRTDDYEQKRARARMEKLKALNEEHAKTLTNYGWIDKNKGSVRLPIERAMELATAELAQKQPVAANPIVVSPPAAPAAPPAPPAAAPAPSTETPQPTKPPDQSPGGGQPTAVNPPPASGTSSPSPEPTPEKQ